MLTVFFSPLQDQQSCFRNEGENSNIGSSQNQNRLPFYDYSSWEVGFLLLQQVVWRTHLQCGGPLTALEKAPCFLPSPFPAETLFRGGFLRKTMGSQTRGMASQPGPSLLAAAVTVLELSAQGGRGVSGSPLFPQNGRFHNCCHKGSSLQILTLPASSVPYDTCIRLPVLLLKEYKLCFSVV